MQVDPERNRVGRWFRYPSAARWQSRGFTAAAVFSPGVYVARFRPGSSRFSRWQPASFMFGPNRRVPQLDALGYQPIVAWSRDGASLLYEDDRAGLLRIDLRTGRRRTVIARRWLGDTGDIGNTAGHDWSADGRRIAYSLRGSTRAPVGRSDPEEHDAPDSGLFYEVWWAAPNGMGRRRLGTGSRPRFSPDGKWLVALDRLPSIPGTGIRLYDLRGPQPSSRMIIEHALSACFAQDSNRLAVVLQNGDLVIADLNGRTVRRLQPRSRLLEGIEFPEGFGPGTIQRAYIDW